MLGFLSKAAKLGIGLAGIFGPKKTGDEGAAGALQELMAKMSERRRQRQQMLASPVGQVAQNIDRTTRMMRGAGMAPGGDAQMSPFFQAAMSRMRQRSQQIDRGY